jgi:hypothetical protein
MISNSVSRPCARRDVRSDYLTCCPTPRIHVGYIDMAATTTGVSSRPLSAARIAIRCRRTACVFRIARSHISLVSAGVGFVDDDDVYRSAAHCLSKPLRDCVVSSGRPGRYRWRLAFPPPHQAASWRRCKRPLRPMRGIDPTLSHIVQRGVLAGVPAELSGTGCPRLSGLSQRSTARQNASGAPGVSASSNAVEVTLCVPDSQSHCGNDPGGTNERFRSSYGDIVDTRPRDGLPREI